MRHGLRWLAMVVGVLGALVCLAIVPAAWVAHGAAQTEARALIDTVDGALAGAATQLATAETAVRAVRSRLDVLRTRAEAVAADTGADEQARTELRALLDRVSGIDYQTVRTAYVGARAQAVATLALLQSFSWIPGVRAPSDEVLQQAAQIDAQIQAIDVELTALRSALVGTELSLSQAATRVAERANALDQQVAALDTTIVAYTTLVNDARARLPEIAATIARIITGLAIVLTLVGLYGVVLHVALFLLGRSSTGQRASVATTASIA
jgi:chromosome segregation ATPase